MRKISILVAVAVAAMIAGFQSANAGLLGMPMGLQSAIQHIKFETPTRTPFAPERNEPGLAGATWLRIVAIATTMLSQSATNFSIADGEHERCC
jgi:uncharacterized membrane protein